MLSYNFLSGVQFRLVQLISHVQLFATNGLQHTRPLCPSPTPRFYSKLMSIWVGDAIQSSYPLSSCSPPAFSLSQHQGLFKWVSSSHQVAKVLVSASVSILPMNIQDWFPSDWLVGSPWSPRDSQQSSPTPQFKSINSLVLRFLYSPTLTSIHDHWKNHSLDYMDLCWQSNVSASKCAV